MTPRSYALPDAAATERAGRALAPAIAGGMTIELGGELGAGKTTLARGVLRGLGHRGPVKSPSYALVEHYRFSSLYLYHFDFYRFANPDEWETAGFSDYFRDDAVCLIEWPERARQFLPRADLVVLLATPASGEGRALTAHAHGAAGERALAALAALSG
jgi:tRNA threonylcarbamoyladenosine biosynthesis protein TsaE